MSRRNRQPMRVASRTVETVTAEYNQLMVEAGHLRRQLLSVIPARLAELDESANRLEREIKNLAPPPESSLACEINDWCVFRANHRGPCLEDSGDNPKDQVGPVVRSDGPPTPEDLVTRQR